MSETMTPPAGPDSAGPGGRPELSGSRSRLALLLAALATGLVVSASRGTFPVVAFTLSIILMIMLHEAGHMAVAKWSGMKVSEYFVGFGPRLWSFRRGETEYGIKAIPAGGYVKIVGMHSAEKGIDPADEPRTYRQASYPRRLATVAAGVVTQFILAFVLLIFLHSVLGFPNYDRPTLAVGSISRLETGSSPAEEAGFRLGDRIVEVDGQPVTGWDQVPEMIRPRAGEAIRFTVDRDGATEVLTAVPAEIDRDGEMVGFVGIGPAPSVDRAGPITAIGRAAGDTVDLTTQATKAIVGFFTPGSLGNFASTLLAGDAPEGDERFVSVVGVVRIAGDAAESGAFFLVYMLVVLNIFIAVFNLVPLLPLDGGHMAIATYERLRSRKGRVYRADVTKMTPVAAAVVAVLLVIGVVSIYLDIVSPVANPFQ
ncbi:MAG: M50 family metallopeptidase [Acidimicrobiales bacterium]